MLVQFYRSPKGLTGIENKLFITRHLNADDADSPQIDADLTGLWGQHKVCLRKCKLFDGYKRAMSTRNGFMRCCTYTLPLGEREPGEGGGGVSSRGGNFFRIT